MSLLLALLVQATPLPAMKVVPGDGNELVVQVDPFEERRLEEIKDGVARTMTATCGKRPIGWGHVSYKGSTVRDGSRPTMVEEYRQSFRCLELDLTKYPHAPADWKATAADETAASKAVASYFEARDSGALDRAFAMLEPNSHGISDKWLTTQESSVE